MREFVDKVFANQPVSIDELNKFILEYYELCGVKDVDSQKLSMTVQHIQSGRGDLRYACKKYCGLKDLQVVEMFDKNNNLMYTKIQD